MAGAAAVAVVAVAAAVATAAVVAGGEFGGGGGGGEESIELNLLCLSDLPATGKNVLSIADVGGAKNIEEV